MARSFFGKIAQKNYCNFVQKTVYNQGFFVIEWHKAKTRPYKILSVTVTATEDAK